MIKHDLLQTNEVDEHRAPEVRRENNDGWKAARGQDGRRERT